MGWDEQQTHRLEMGVGSSQERRETRDELAAVQYAAAGNIKIS